MTVSITAIALIHIFSPLLPCGVYDLIAACMSAKSGSATQVFGNRFDFSLFPKPHGLYQGKAKKAVWFGFAYNAHETLPQLAPAIRKFGLELLVIYTQKDEISALNPKFVRYEHNSSKEYIAESDLLLNPRSNRAGFRYKYKSDIK